MKNKTGLWIDHRKAVVVTITDGIEEIKQIDSDIEKDVRPTGAAARDIKAEDMRDRRTMKRLNSYYDAVIACLHDSEAVYIFGPGEAKIELKARIEHVGLKDLTVVLEAEDKMTDNQVAAKTRQHFLEK